jgi:hypothetical protein
MLADEKHIYWAEGPRILRSPHESGGVEVVSEGMPWCGPLAQDETHVYWAATSFGGTMGGLLRAAKAGGPAEVLCEIACRPTALAVDPTSETLYWSSDSRVFALPTSGGTERPVAERDAEILALTVFDGELIGATDEEIFALPQGGMARSLCESRGEVLSLLACEDGTLYWGATEKGHGDIYSLDTSGQLRSIAGGQVSPPYIALTGAHLWWADADSGLVARKAR